MQANLPKRFYSTANAAPHDEGGLVVHLDGKPVRTPARSILAVSSSSLAGHLAAEWEAQTDVIDPRTMPLTRLVNTALDGVAKELSAVVEDILRFAANDMLFYRASHPVALAERQRLRWDPVLEGLESRLGARFSLTEGVMHVTQPDETLVALRSHVAGLTDAVEVTALHSVTTLTGSGLLALAMRSGDLNGDEAWALAHLDEDWNIEQWGEDAEAVARRAARKFDMDAASLVMRHLMDN